MSQGVLFIPVVAFRMVAAVLPFQLYLAAFLCCCCADSVDRSCRPNLHANSRPDCHSETGILSASAGHLPVSCGHCVPDDGRDCLCSADTQSLPRYLN